MNDIPLPSPLGAADPHGLEGHVVEILDGLAEGFVAFDFDWRVTYCNRAAETHFRRRREELIGRSFWREVADHVEQVGELRGFLGRVMASRQPAEAEVASELYPGHWIAFRAFPLESGLAVNFRDVTVRRDRTARLAELERRRAFILELTDTIRTISEPGELLTAAARLVAERLGCSRVGYAEISDDRQAIIIRGEWSTLGGPPLAGVSFPTSAFGPVVAEDLEAGVAVAVSDTAADPRTAPFAAAYDTVLARALLNVPLMRSGRVEAFVFASSREPRVWTREDIALAEEVAGRTFSALARARTEMALRESEARFRAMADSAPSPVWVTSAAGPVEFVNRAFCEIVGRPFDELLADSWIGLMHPDDVAGVVQARLDARSEVRTYGFEARFRHADGGWRWMRASCQPRFDAQGVFQGYVGMSMDITEARRAEEHQALLINELNHRVKNTLATVQSLARQTLRDGLVTREARERFTERLLALSTAHNVLTRRNWESAELAEIAEEAVRPWTPRIVLAGPNAQVAPNVALAVSMALHELATNAVKYGALSAAAGRVDVVWSLEDGAVALTWTESGGPPVSAPVGARGFGSRLLTQGLAGELGAPAELDYQDAAGLVCRLRAPMAAGAA
jgi:PAS domain S-box-containing protein